MNRLRSFFTFAAMLLACGFTRAQGPLDPSGAPAPTMKTLQQIYDRLDQLSGLVATQQQTLAYISAEFGAERTWHENIIDATDTPGMADFAQAPDGTLAVAYIRQSAAGQLWYAKFNGATWDRVLLDATGAWRFPSLTFNASNRALVAYYSADKRTIKFGHQTTVGGSWTNRIVATDPGFSLESVSVALDQTTPVVSYRDNIYDILGLASTPDYGATWNFEVRANNAGLSARMRTQPSGRPAIVHNTSTGTPVLVYHYRGTSLWFTETIATARGDSDLRWAPDGFPAVTYTAVDDSELWYAKWNGSTFNVQPLDGGAPYAFSTPSVGFNQAGQPLVVAAEGGTLRAYEYNGAAWTQSVIASNAVGRPRLVMRSGSFQPLVLSQTSGGLKYWMRGMPP